MGRFTYSYEPKAALGPWSLGALMKAGWCWQRAISSLGSILSLTRWGKDAGHEIDQDHVCNSPAMGKDDHY